MRDRPEPGPPPWLIIASPAVPDRQPPDAVTLDGAAGRTRAALFTALAAALDLPAHFGRNWDALADSLRDRIAEAPLTLVIDAADQLLADEPPGQFTTLLAVLGGAAADAPGALRIVLRGEKDELRRRIGAAT